MREGRLCLLARMNPRSLDESDRVMVILALHGEVFLYHGVADNITPRLLHSPGAVAGLGDADRVKTKVEPMRWAVDRPS